MQFGIAYLSCQNVPIIKHSLTGYLFTFPCTVVHDFNGNEVNGKHGFNGKKCYDGGFYAVNNGKNDV